MLDFEVDELEKKGFKTLDVIVQKVSRNCLDSLRNVKSTLNRLLVRVGRIKEVGHCLLLL